MSTLDEIIHGLLIIQSFEPNTSLRAEHDEIWCGDGNTEYHPSAKEKLEKLGWTMDEGCGWHRFV